MNHVSAYKQKNLNNNDLLNEYGYLVNEFKSLTKENDFFTKEYIRGKIDMLSFIAINMLNIDGSALDNVAQKVYEEDM